MWRFEVGGSHADKAAVFRAGTSTKTGVKRTWLVSTKLPKIGHLYHPLLRVWSHIFPIIPMLDSGKLFEFACPMHCWTSNRSSSRRLPLKHSADPSFIGDVHDVASKISNFEKRSFQPMFLCEMPQQFLARVESRCAEFRAADPSNKSRMELQPRIGPPWSGQAKSGLHASSEPVRQKISKKS